MRINISPKYWLLVISLVLLVAYSLYQARAVLIGPKIWIENPQDGETVREPLITIEGRSSNIAWISLNGRQIFTDEFGDWKEKLIVATGTSIMTVEARDRFGRETRKSIKVVLN